MDLERLQAMINVAQAQSPLGSGINQSSGMGINPYGGRHADSLNSPMSMKGLGYFGRVPHSGGQTSTELSSSFTQDGKTVEHPLMVPGLTADEMRHLMSGAKPTAAIYKKAQDFTLSRIDQNKSAFAGPQDLRLPNPMLRK